MCEGPRVVLKPMPYVMCVQQVDEVSMRAVDGKVKAERFKEDLLCIEYLIRNFINFLEGAKKKKVGFTRAHNEKR